MNYIGLDIGGTKCAATLANVTDGLPQIIEKEKFPTAGLAPKDVLARFSAFIEKHLDEEIQGIGVSCGGPLDSNNGIVMRPPSLPDWDNIKVVKYFEDKFGIKTYLQNDANACAVAEWKFGAGTGTKNMVFVTCGTGFGAGLILNGKLYSGANDNAGEIGHVRLTDDGPYGYYKYGSCEGYCSGGGIARLAEMMAKTKRYTELSKPLYEKTNGNITAKDVADFARQGDAFSLAVIKKSGEMLGRSLSIIVDILNPEKIVIGGVFMRADDLLLPHCLRVMKKECLSYSFNAVQVVPASLGENVGDYAAIAVAQGDF